MRYLKLPILWMDAEMVNLDDLGIETTYSDTSIKILTMNINCIEYYFADKNPQYTCISLTSGSRLVVDMCYSDFENWLTKSTN